jgi:hypothetical protein
MEICRVGLTSEDRHAYSARRERPIFLDFCGWRSFPNGSAVFQANCRVISSMDPSDCAAWVGHGVTATKTLTLSGK